MKVRDLFAPMLDLSRFPVDGVVSTAITFEELKAAIRIIVFKNLKYIGPCLLSVNSALLKNRSVFSLLSEKELDVAMAISSAKRNSEIAAELNISHKTVSTCRTWIFKKLNIDSDLPLFILPTKMRH